MCFELFCDLTEQTFNTILVSYSLEFSIGLFWTIESPKFDSAVSVFPALASACLKVHLVDNHEHRNLVLLRSFIDQFDLSFVPIRGYGIYFKYCPLVG